MRISLAFAVVLIGLSAGICADTIDTTPTVRHDDHDVIVDDPCAHGMYSSDKSIVVQRDSSRAVVVRDLKQNTFLYSLVGHQGWIRHFTISPNDRVLATAGDDGRIVMWDLRTGICLQVIPPLEVQFKLPGALFYFSAYTNALCVSFGRQHYLATDSLTGLVVEPIVDRGTDAKNSCPPREAFIPREFDPQPLPDTEPQPVYPAGARGTGVTGKVVVAVCVDKHGEVRDWEIINSMPKGMGFEDAVSRVVGKWKFTPALQHDIPIDVWFEVPFIIKPE